jgi:TetR/AcrR family transcriptional regulator, ethionamide resistance regulator
MTDEPVAKVDAILQTTERLLETHSLEDLRVADILSQAGASKAAFYANFANKAVVVAELVRRGIDEATPIAEAALRSERMIDRDVLALAIQGWLLTLSRHRPLILAAIDGRARHPELAQLYQNAFSRLRARIPMDPASGAAVLAVAESTLEGYLRRSPHLSDAAEVAAVLASIYHDMG